MSTASDTWKGAGCAKGWGFSTPYQRRISDSADELAKESIEKLRSQNRKGKIDPLSNFASGRAVHIISGENDPVVPPQN